MAGRGLAVIVAVGACAVASGSTQHAEPVEKVDFARRRADPSATLLVQRSRNGSAFGRRRIPRCCVAPSSNTPGIVTPLCKLRTVGAPDVSAVVAPLRGPLRAFYARRGGCRRGRIAALGARAISRSLH